MPSSVEDRDVTWKEANTALPPWPNDSDLVEFHVDDPSSRLRQYIDAKSITVGRDGVVRYTLVVDSGTGARNVSFEGLRCTPHGMFKLYGYGAGGRFKRTAGEWQEIHGPGYDKIHRDLHGRILCVPREFKPRPKGDMIRYLRVAVPHETGTGFQAD